MPHGSTLALPSAWASLSYPADAHAPPQAHFRSVSLPGLWTCDTTCPQRLPVPSDRVGQRCSRLLGVPWHGGQPLKRRQEAHLIEWLLVFEDVIDLCRHHTPNQALGLADSMAFVQEAAEGLTRLGRRILPELVVDDLQD